MKKEEGRRGKKKEEEGRRGKKKSDDAQDFDVLLRHVFVRCLTVASCVCFDKRHRGIERRRRRDARGKKENKKR